MSRYSTLVIIMMFVLIAFLFANINYRNNLIEEQKDKITDLQIELDSEKEKSYQLELEKKRSVLDERST